MANSRPRSSSLFSGMILIFVGLLLLLHNYRGLDIRMVLGHWWPLILIVWGAVKLYERTAASRSGDPGSARITAGEVFLVLGLLALMGIVVGGEILHEKFPGEMPVEWGDKYDYDLNVAPKPVPADARITIRNTHGDISVHASDDSQIRVGGKKFAHSWSEKDAGHLAAPVTFEIVQNGDGYEIHPSGANSGDSRVSFDLDVAVPKKASLTVRNERGDVTVADLAKPVTINTTNGDVEVRDITGDVTIDTRKGDVKVSDTKGNVKLSGHGGEVNVSGVSGGLTLDGEFYGPIRADKVAKGVRFISQRTDLTLAQLTGHMEAGSGNLEIADAPGNLTLRTNSYNVSIENASGKVKVDNRNGDVDVRFSSAPKEDIEINNASASITLTLPDSSSFDMLANCHSGDINSEFHGDSLKQTSTESGDSHLEGKYGSGRGPKVTLKTSYGSISLRRTSSDVSEPEAEPRPGAVPAPPAPPRVKAPHAPKPEEN
jgi:DUF4097 and DUF4098 domain-containing protein YvlB